MTLSKSSSGLLAVLVIVAAMVANHLPTAPRDVRAATAVQPSMIAGTPAPAPTVQPDQVAREALKRQSRFRGISPAQPAFPPSAIVMHGKICDAGLRIVPSITLQADGHRQLDSMIFDPPVNVGGVQRTSLHMTPTPGYLHPPPVSITLQNPVCGISQQFTPHITQFEDGHWQLDSNTFNPAITFHGLTGTSISYVIYTTEVKLPVLHLLPPAP